MAFTNIAKSADLIFVNDKRLTSSLQQKLYS